jgi:hypothetical protein
MWSQDPQKASARFQTALHYFEQGFNRLPADAGARIEAFWLGFLKDSRANPLLAEDGPGLLSIFLRSESVAVEKHED